MTRAFRAIKAALMAGLLALAATLVDIGMGVARLAAQTPLAGQTPQQAQQAADAAIRKLDLQTEFPREITPSGSSPGRAASPAAVEGAPSGRHSDRRCSTGWPWCRCSA